MVNFINDERQMFRGMFVPTGSPRGPCGHLRRHPVRPEQPRPGGTRRLRLLPPHVVAQQSQLALEDVFDYPRFKGNPLVNDLGVRSYLGTPRCATTPA